MKIYYRSAEINDFDEQMQRLIEKAKQQTELSYAPYSNFSVGAAVLLEDGTVVCGNNQENIAYPSGLCAERTAMFYTNSQYPDIKPIAMAVAARNGKDFLENPICPCGACRQSLLETELRYKSPIKTILYGTKNIYVINSIADMLPFAFISFD
ncbi:cytidine deaminase [Porphyromonadaceae bacterium COT-184 OH4590]|nr:cytidine deaminase [Porphyromonadaceae bacterium COT-184 OH4590]